MADQQVINGTQYWTSQQIVNGRPIYFGHIRGPKGNYDEPLTNSVGFHVFNMLYPRQYSTPSTEGYEVVPTENGIIYAPAGIGADRESFVKYGREEKPNNRANKVVKAYKLARLERRGAIEDIRRVNPIQTTPEATFIPAPDKITQQYTVINHEIVGQINISQFLSTILNELNKIRANFKIARIGFVDGVNIDYRMLRGTDFKQLSMRLKDIMTGLNRVEGSDALTPYSALDTNHFQILYRNTLNGGFKPQGVSTKTAPIHDHFYLWDAKENGVNNCLFNILRPIINKLRADNGQPKITYSSKALRKVMGIAEDLQIPADQEMFDKLAEHIEYDINVITDISVKPDSERVFEDDERKPFNKNLCLTNDVTTHYAVKTNIFPQNKVSIDIMLIDGHYCGITSDTTPEGLKKLVCPITGDLYSAKYGFNEKWDGKGEYIYNRLLEQNRTYFTCKDQVVADRIKQELKYIFYDFETVYNPDGELVPYSLGYAIFTEDEMNQAAENPEYFASCKTRVMITKASNFSNCKNVCHQVTKNLLDTLQYAERHIKYVLISFNGSSFDHFILARAAADREILINVFATNNVLRGLKIGYNRQYHTAHQTLDMAKILPNTTLHNACINFNTIPKKLEGFDHWEVQKAYQNCENMAQFADGWLKTNQKQHDEYLNGDVLSLASLTVKCRQAIKDATGIELFTTNKQTAAGIAFAYMQKICKIPQALKNKEDDDFIRRSIIGGRTQVYNEHYFEGEAQMIDFTSLYPTVMSLPQKYIDNQIFPDNFKFCEYPTTNEIEHVTEFIDDKVGFYEVTILKQPNYNIIPFRVTKDDDSLVADSLDWECKKQFDAVITHFDIKLIKEYGGDVKIIRGIVFKESSRDLMKDYIELLAQKKDEQDELKATKSPQYNSALREFYKLLLNSSSGKFLQKNYDDAAIYAKGLTKFAAAIDQMQPETCDIIPINNSCSIVTGKLLDVKYSERSKPSYIGCLIYSYARGLLYRCCINAFGKSVQNTAVDAQGPVKPLYSDTDSMLLSKSDCEKVFELFPYLNPEGRKKQRGDLEPELKDHKKVEAYMIEKKDYGVFLFDDKNELMGDKSKIRIKGINQRRDKLLTEDEAIAIDELIQAGRSPATSERGGLEEAAVEYNTRETLTPSDILEISRKRLKNEKCYFMCSQIRKSYKTGKFKLEQVYMVKVL